MMLSSFALIAVLASAANANVTTTCSATVQRDGEIIREMREIKPESCEKLQPSSSSIIHWRCVYAMPIEKGLLLQLGQEYRHSAYDNFPSIDEVSIEARTESLSVKSTSGRVYDSSWQPKAQLFLRTKHNGHVFEISASCR
jgi:hypothetical protein